MNVKSLGLFLQIISTHRMNDAIKIGNTDIIYNFLEI